MVRKSSINKYELDVRKGLQELFDKCRHNMKHSGDLLLCQQNGFIDYKGRPCVGLGDEGLNCMQQVNFISFNGIGNITDDNDYYKKEGNNFFYGNSEFEADIIRQHITYMNIWENSYFLRVFTQVVNVLNGLNYNWNLTFKNLKPNQKSEQIRGGIIKLLDLSPNFQRILKDAYVGQIRNAVAHTQYHCIQGGILYDNYSPSSKYSILQGLSYEEWEKKYVYSFFIFIGIFQMLKQITNEFYLPCSQLTFAKGVPIQIPLSDNKGYAETYLYPNQKGDIWRFTRII